jgi:hypothetical protein
MPESAIGLTKYGPTKEQEEELINKGYIKHNKYPFMFSHPRIPCLWFDVRNIEDLKYWDAPFAYIAINEDRFIRVYDMIDLFNTMDKLDSL